MKAAMVARLITVVSVTVVAAMEVAIIVAKNAAAALMLGSLLLWCLLWRSLYGCYSSC